MSPISLYHLHLSIIRCSALPPYRPCRTALFVSATNIHLPDTEAQVGASHASVALLNVRFDNWSGDCFGPQRSQPRHTKEGIPERQHQECLSASPDTTSRLAWHQYKANPETANNSVGRIVCYTGSVDGSGESVFAWPKSLSQRPVVWNGLVSWADYRCGSPPESRPMTNKLSNGRKRLTLHW
jgi:hypothetical protein